MSAWLFVLGIVCLLLPDSANAKATAFALIGDPHHSPDTSRIALTQTLVVEAGVTIDFTTDVTQLNATNLKGYALLILFRDGFNPNNSFWMTAAQGTAVKQFARNGGSILFYHNSSHIALTNDSVKAALGGVYAGHPAIRPYSLRITDTTSPIAKGVANFTVTDEQHYPYYYLDSSHIFMKSVNESGLTFQDDNGLQRGTTALAGWASTYGAGKICYLAPGHTLATLRNPEYVKMQKNAVAWLLKSTQVLPPQAGAARLQEPAILLRWSNGRVVIIDYRMATTGMARVSLYNASGRRISRMQTALAPGQNSCPIAYSQLGSGVYRCAIERDNVPMISAYIMLTR
jgi:type 1 glutamine amidotransferase